MTGKSKRSKARILEEKNLNALKGLLKDYNSSKKESVVARGIETMPGKSGCLLLVPLSLGESILKQLFGDAPDPKEKNKIVTP